MTAEKLTKQMQENLAQLQLLQQRLQVFSAQKQQFQLQLLEIDNALTELKTAKQPTYILVGGILVEKSKLAITKDLEEKKKELVLKIKSYEVQENKTREKAKELQGELAKVLR